MLKSVLNITYQPRLDRPCQGCAQINAHIGVQSLWLVSVSTFLTGMCLLVPFAMHLVTQGGDWGYTVRLELSR